MRKVIVFNMISADGYFEGPNHELGWHNVDATFNDFAVPQLKEADTIVFGRQTYEMMYSFWSSEAALKDDPVVSTMMNDMDKIVFSKSLEKAEWKHTTLLGEDSITAFKARKEQSGKALLILGSSNLCVSLLESNLIDELRLMVNPVVLGKGNTLFAGLKEPKRLRLLDTQTFESGNILLRYVPVN
jgi:dihydrofolate reductase